MRDREDIVLKQILCSSGDRASFRALAAQREWRVMKERSSPMLVTRPHSAPFSSVDKISLKTNELKLVVKNYFLRKENAKFINI